jgi:hypothetical protein
MGGITDQSGGYTREALGLAVNMRDVLARQSLKLAAAETFDRKLAADRGQLKRFGKSGRLHRQISVVAVMNAVNTEGRGVLKKDAEGYWKDQDRRYFGITEGSANVTVMKNRLGKVTYRKVYGREGTREYGSLPGKRPSSVENKNITIMVI